MLETIGRVLGQLLERTRASGGGFGRDEGRRFWGHWQNLNEKPGDRYGSALLHGRGKLYFGERSDVSLEWHLRSKSAHASVTVGDDEDDLDASIALPPVGLYFGARTPLLRGLLERLGVGETVRGSGSRQVRVSFHEAVLYWNVWTHPGEWHSSTPRWRDGSLDFADVLLGRRVVEERELERAEKVEIPMPEGIYLATVRLEHVETKRPRWFGSSFRCARVDPETPIPVPGKGENAWDCGEDALYSSSVPDVRTVPEAVGRVVASVLRSRERHGGRGWRPAPKTPEVEVGQIWESVDGPARTRHDGKPAGLCRVVAKNDSRESPNSWVMLSLGDSRTLYMHERSRNSGLWVFREAAPEQTPPFQGPVCPTAPRTFA